MGSSPPAPRPHPAPFSNLRTAQIRNSTFLPSWIAPHREPSAEQKCRTCTFPEPQRQTSSVQLGRDSRSCPRATYRPCSLGLWAPPIPERWAKGLGWRLRAEWNPERCCSLPKHHNIEKPTKKSAAQWGRVIVLQWNFLLHVIEESKSSFSSVWDQPFPCDHTTVGRETLAKRAEIASLVTLERRRTRALTQWYQQSVGKRQLD